MSTPTAITEITAAWLSEALGRSVEISSTDVIGAGQGFMGELGRVNLVDDAQASVIVKLPTRDPGGHAIGEMMGVWTKEHGFYRDLAHRLEVRTPEPYVNLLDPPCLVLEDLAPMVPGDQVVGATLEQATAAIDAIADHHAQFFGDESLIGLDWLPSLQDESAESLGPMFAMGWPGFLERYKDRLPIRALRWCEEFVDMVPKWLEGYADAPWTLTHGDYRLDNMFFDADGSIAVIDWQLCMRAPGQADLVYFCANNLTIDARRMHDEMLIARYVHRLHAGGVPDDKVGLDDVRRGYKEGLVFYAASFGASLMTIDSANERGFALFDALVERTFAAVEDLDAGHVLGLSG